MKTKQLQVFWWNLLLPGEENSFLQLDVGRKWKERCQQNKNSSGVVKKTVCPDSSTFDLMKVVATN